MTATLRSSFAYNSPPPADHTVARVLAAGSALDLPGVDTTWAREIANWGREAGALDEESVSRDWASLVREFYTYRAAEAARLLNPYDPAPITPRTPVAVRSDADRARRWGVREWSRLTALTRRRGAAANYDAECAATITFNAALRVLAGWLGDRRQELLAARAAATAAVEARIDESTITVLASMWCETAVRVGDAVAAMPAGQLATTHSGGDVEPWMRLRAVVAHAEACRVAGKPARAARLLSGVEVGELVDACPSGEWRVVAARARLAGPGQAVGLWVRAIALARAGRDPVVEAELTVSLALAHKAAGEFVEASGAVASAIALLTVLGPGAALRRAHDLAARVVPAAREQITDDLAPSLPGRGHCAA
ncbi:hypothetical protein [Actinokineospora cianjurensis]|uniref:Uncharacterized protein n=1 Tax=Actinokineospora cianjurensis TaxID=585224 RepID=A0A421B284_9PSEU|nr:hypothetical protein [Actinokineospora cianjurensis]RLK58406.1 hypothetical protein CLV68_4507 [Actinokineospora cianjurensis]